MYLSDFFFFLYKIQGMTNAPFSTYIKLFNGRRKYVFGKRQYVFWMSTSLIYTPSTGKVPILQGHPHKYDYSNSFT